MPRFLDFLNFLSDRPPRDLKILEEPIEGKEVKTSRGGPNMPKYQFCQCGLSSRRVEKTRGGANYGCRRHGKFFVRTP